MNRDYTALLSRVTPASTREASMQALVDLLWPMLSERGVSWIGFYLPADDETMVLGPRRDKPACSPIGLHGACGRAFLTRIPLIVRDVAELGDGYIACDSRDRSEIVIPLFERDGRCWGVLDADSYDVGSFSEADLIGLNKLLMKAGLTWVNGAGDS